MKYKFNIGDRVKVLDGSKIENYTCGWAMKEAIGKEGVITNRNVTRIEKRPSYNIKFDDSALDNWLGTCDFDERGLELVGINSINFIIVGRRVISQMYDSNGVIAESEARCHPDDEFDLKTGINIALDRLLAKTSLYNGKVVCVENNGFVKFPFTKGKIYNVVDGEIKDDNGKTFIKSIRSLDKLENIKGLAFIPLVE